MIGEQTPDRFFATEAVSSMFIHIEDDKETTDRFMGMGSYDRITNGMKILKEQGYPFGFAITINRENFDRVTNEGFLGDLRDEGYWGEIFFPYVPVGRNPKPEPMLTLGQRQNLAEITSRSQKKGS